MKGSARDNILAGREGGKMGDPLVQWGMIEIGEAQEPRDRERVAFINPEPKRECENETRDEEAREDGEGEPIFLGVRRPTHPNSSYIPPGVIDWNGFDADPGTN